MRSAPTSRNPGAARPAHGIFPPLLVSGGLTEALPRRPRASLPTTVDSAGVSRHPAEVEAAVYFCCLEALQNAGKHAGDEATASVRVWEDDTLLGFEVTDDGAGFDPAGARQGGHGFVNMTDRLGAFGGTPRREHARPRHDHHRNDPVRCAGCAGDSLTLGHFAASERRGLRGWISAKQRFVVDRAGAASGRKRDRKEGATGRARCRCDVSVNGGSGARRGRRGLPTGGAAASG